jgi:outer membrane receptor protein involved in Fe transport
MLKGDLTSQVNKNNQIKTGFEFQYINMDMKMIQYAEAYYDGTSDGQSWSDHGVFRSFYERSPKQMAMYVQDKLEYGGLIANIGIRADIFLQAGEVLEDSTKEDLVSVSGNEIGYEIKSSRFKLSPRLGMSYPVTDRAKLFFSYGHFYQLPGYDYYYQTPTQGGSALRLIGNPNIDFQRTVSYEIGVAYAISDLITTQFSGYYRDIYDLLNTTTTRNGPIVQSIYKNVDYARSRGIEFSFEKGLKDYWSLTANYQFAFAYGKSSSDRSGYDAILDQTAIPLRDLPLDWDQRHNATINLDFSVRNKEHPNLFGLKLPDNWGLNLLFTIGSGFPYTPSDKNPKWESTPGEKAWERTNALNMPFRYNLDVRFSKSFTWKKLDYGFYFDVDNITNRRNVEEVYSDTGEPDVVFYTSGIPYSPTYAQDPTHWSAPRAVRFGVRLNW